jgi:hypothetical protein
MQDCQIDMERQDYINQINDLKAKKRLIYVWREVMSGRSTLSLRSSKNTNYESMTPEMVVSKQNS